jgi:hypothetical protein
MGLYQRAINRYNQDGFQALIGSTLQYLGRSIGTGNDSLLQQKRNVIESYSDTPFFLNVGGEICSGRLACP